MESTGRYRHEVYLTPWYKGKSVRIESLLPINSHAGIVARQRGLVLRAFDEAAFGRALEREPYLLQKIVQATTHNRSPLALVTLPQERAYPGQIIPNAADAPCIGVVSTPFLSRIPVAPASHRFLVVGSTEQLLPNAVPTVPAHSSWVNHVIGAGSSRFERLLSGLPFATKSGAYERLPHKGLSYDGGGLLIVVPWIVHGGADRAVVDLLHGLDALGLCTRRYLVHTMPAEMCWASQVLPFVDGNFHLDSFEPKIADHLACLVEALRISTLFIMNSKAGFDALPLIKARCPALRVVTQFHCLEIDPVTGARDGYPIYVSQRYDHYIDAYTVISRALGKTMVDELGIRPEKIHAIHLGIDRARFEACRRPRFVAGKPATVLWLGRLTSQKEPAVVLQVGAAWRARHGEKTLNFVVAGGGDLDDEIRRLHRELDLGRLVMLMGAVADPRPLYEQADCLLLTSRFEGIPVVIFEAMAAELAVITPTENTAITEVLDSRVARFVNPWSSVEGYVVALEQLLSNAQEARSVASAIHKRADEFSRERYAKEMAEVFAGQGTGV